MGPSNIKSWTGSITAYKGIGGDEAEKDGHQRLLVEWKVVEFYLVVVFATEKRVLL